MSGAHERRVFGLDLLRAFAIACVVLSHAGLAFSLIALGQHGPAFLQPILGWIGIIQHGGVVGVEVFFVLSGFLIGRILLRSAAEAGQPRSLFLFYCRRWFRTLPLFWLFIVLNVLLELWLHGRPLALGEALSHAFFLRNFGHVSISFFIESWSLAVEEWFYLLFPAVLWIWSLVGIAGAQTGPWARAREEPAGAEDSRARLRDFDRVFLVCAGAFYLLSLVSRCLGARVPGSDWAGNQRCTVLYRFDALMTGVLAAWASVRHPGRWRRHAAVCAAFGIAASLGAYASIWTFTRFGPGLAPDNFFARTFRFSLFSLGFALLLPTASLWTPKRETLLHLAVRRIALWSYAMYLVNWPLFQILGTPRFSWFQASWGRSVLLFAIKVTAAIAVSAAFYRFYEAPCTRLRERIPLALGRQKAAAQPQTQSAG